MSANPDTSAASILGVDANSTPEHIKATADRLEAELLGRLNLNLPESIKSRLNGQLAALREARDQLLHAAQAVRAVAPTEIRPVDGGMESKVGATFAKRYELIEEIGAGGMGRVYRAFDKLKQVYVAVKVIAPEIIKLRGVQERFVQEAKNATTLSHPNIIRVHDVGIDGDGYFITMELLHGRTLRKVMDDQKRARMPYPLAQGLAMANDLLDALVYAHQHVIHRDIKPENIWVGDDGVVKLMDFGLALPSDGSNKSRPMQSVGSVYYVAPEVMRGGSVDHRADQFSLAVVLYELFTGHVPAGVAKPVSQLRRDLPAPVSRAIMKALSPTASERFATTRTLKEALSRRAGNAMDWGAPFRVAAGVLLAVVLLGGGYAGYRAISSSDIHLFQTADDREMALRDQVAANDGFTALEQAAEEVELRARTERETLGKLREALLAGGTNKPNPAQIEAAREEADGSQHALDLMRARVYSAADKSELNAQRLLGETLFKENKFTDASKAFRIVRDGVAQRLAPVQNISELSRQRDLALAAGAAWATQHDGEPASAEATASEHMQRAEAALAAGRFDEAVAGYRDAAQVWGKMESVKVARTNEHAAAVASAQQQVVIAARQEEQRKADAATAAAAAAAAAAVAAEEARKAEVVRPGRRFRDALRSGGQGPEMVVQAKEEAKQSLKDGANLGAGRSGPYALSAAPVSADVMQDYVRRSGGSLRTTTLREVYRSGGTSADPDAFVMEDARAYAEWLRTETGQRYEVARGAGSADSMQKFWVRRPLE